MQVDGPPVTLRPFAGLEPDAAQLRVDLAGAVLADSATRAVTQLLGAGHRAGVAGDRERALAAHPAAEKLVLDLLLGGGEDPVPRPRALQPPRELALAGVGRQHPLDAVQQRGGQPGPHRPRPRRDAPCAPAARRVHPHTSLGGRSPPTVVICQRTGNLPAISPKVLAQLAKRLAGAPRWNPIW